MDNLRNIRKERKITMKELGKIIGVAESTIGMYETGKREPDYSTLTRLADYFGVSTDYLLGRDVPRDNIKIDDEIEIDDQYQIPILGTVVAGIPIECQEDIEGYVYISYKPKEEYFALRVHGNSMIGAGIYDKSILIVHKQEDAESGEIIVAMIDGEQTVKRFKKYCSNKKEHICLMPENPDFDPIPIFSNDNFIILGKVVEVRMQF